MKFYGKLFMMLASAAMLCLTSCVEEAADPAGQGTLPSNVATLQDQVSAMKSSVIEIESLQAELGEVPELAEYSAQLEACAVSVKEHISFVEAGLSGADAAIAAMNLQSRIAEATGTVKVALAIMDNDSFRKDILSIEKSVASWLGKDFRNHFDVSAEQSRLCSMIEVVDHQSLSIDAIASDVEAGLRVGDASSLKTVLASVGEASESLSTLNQKMTTLGAEVEKCYTDAIKSATPATKSALKAVNTKAAAAMEETGVTLEDLSNRIASCESDIAELDSRLEKVEADIKELLGMIQSATFLSEYSEEYVIAYYNMDNNSKVTALGKPYDGKSLRTPVETIDLNYMIRPASAAAAVTKEVVSVVGYYADRIQTQAIDPTKFVNFTVNDVSVTNAERGIVTVTVSHNLKDDFYYRETGAKCALFIATGQTDVASKFVELYPKDRSTNVYVDGISINLTTDGFQIDEGETKTLTAVVTPSDATNRTVSWSSSNTEVATINAATGELTAVSTGKATITAKTNDVNEWGDPLTASVAVEVMPSIRLDGSPYVEVGKTAELYLSFPPAMNIESKVWVSSDEAKATVNEDGVVTGVEHNYNEFTFVYEPKVVISCIINGNTTLTHEMEVVVPQPTGVRFNDYADDVTSVDIKLAQPISLAGTLIPDESNAEYFTAEYFTIKYSASKDGSAVVGFVDYQSGSINAPGSTGTWTVTATVDDENDDDNRLKKSVKRSMVINVEPYYVESVTLPETMNMTPNSTATLTATFTSDVAGKQPTNTALIWESDHPEIVSVNDTTGVIEAKVAGTATITAKTAKGATSDSSVKTATCVVTVKEPAAAVNIGDYYYSDGTWGSSANPSGKTVIGVIFSNANAVAADPILARDYPLCSNGLVIAKAEYTNQDFGSVSTYNGHGYYAALEEGYDANSIVSTAKENGYGNTLAHRDLNASRSGYCTFFNATDGVVAKQTKSVPVPSGASSWYIPSYKEMRLMYDNRSTINDSLTAIGGDTVSSERYWSSTIYGTWYQKGQTWDHFKYTFNMTNGGWHDTQSATGNFPVRVVLAF